MEIILQRHGYPQVSGEEKILGSEFCDWLEKYRNTDIEPIIWEKEKVPVIYCSSLKRSISTARQIGTHIVVKEDLCEADLPKLKFPRVRLKWKYWIFIARIIWICGYSKGCESQKKFKERIGEVVTWLESMTHPEKLYLVGHGWLNRSLTKELQKRNWILIESNGNGFLSYQKLRTQ